MIVIFSNSFDSATVDPVYKSLKARGEDVLLYLADHVTSGKVRQSLTLDDEGKLQIRYDDRLFTILPGVVDLMFLWKMSQRT